MTIRRLMIGMALLVPILLLIRGEGDFTAGALIVGGSVAALAYRLMTDAIRRKKAEGSPIGRWMRIKIVLKSATLALAIIVWCDSSFLVTYWLIESSDDPIGCRRQGLSEIGMMGGLLACWAAISLSRHLVRSRVAVPGSKG